MQRIDESISKLTQLRDWHVERALGYPDWSRNRHFHAFAAETCRETINNLQVIRETLLLLQKTVQVMHENPSSPHQTLKGV